MTRENAQKLAPIIKAFGDGKKIQFLQDGIWVDLSNPEFGANAGLYRVRPEPLTVTVWALADDNEICVTSCDMSGHCGYKKGTATIVFE